MKSVAAIFRLGKIKRMPCVCCAMIGMPQPLITEVHHLVDKGTRKASGGDFATIPLCIWHHRAEPRYGMTKTQMFAIYGPSLKYQGFKGGFVDKWGTERELLEEINKKLERKAA